MQSSSLIVAFALLSGCVSRQSKQVANGDAGGPSSDAGDAGDAAVAQTCALQAVTDIVPATTAIAPYNGLASDGTSLFVIHPGDSRLSRVPVNGGTLAPIADYSMLVMHVYPGIIIGADATGVVKVATDGSTEARIVDGHLATDVGLAGTTVFWVDRPRGGPGPSQVWSVAIDGSSPHPINGGNGNISSLAVVGSALFWIDSDFSGTSFSIHAATLIGTENDNPVTIPGTATAAAADGYGFYVSDGTQILYFPWDPFIAPTVLVPDQPMVTSIVLDQDRVYWTKNIDCVTDPNIGNGTTVCGGVISSVAKAGGTPVDMPGSDNARLVAVDDNCIYWTTTEGQFHLEAPIGIRGAPKALARP